MVIQKTMRRSPFDTRFSLFRLIGNDWKLSVSLHPFFWYWQRSWQQFRLTICGINLHWRDDRLRPKEPGYSIEDLGAIIAGLLMGIGIVFLVWAHFHFT